MNLKYPDSIEYKKLAVCITFHYVEERLKYFAEVCSELVEIAPFVNLTIVTNATEIERTEKIEPLINKNKIDLEFLTPSGLGHPYLLAWSHLEVFKEKIEDQSYSHFLYLEDDIKITRANITYWLEARQLLKKYGFIPSFFRIEKNHSDGKFYSSDVIEKMSMYDCPILNIDSDHSFIGIVYPYQGLYLLDRELMYEHLSGVSSCPDFDHSDGGLIRIPSHNLRERAALCLSFINVPKGFRSRNLLPFNYAKNEIGPQSFVHHLPDNYANNFDLIAGKIRVDDLFIHKSISTFVKAKIKIFVKFILNKIIHA